MTKLTARPACRRPLQSVKTALLLQVGLLSAEQLVIVARELEIEVLRLVVEIKFFAAILGLEVT